MSSLSITISNVHNIICMSRVYKLEMSYYKLHPVILQNLLLIFFLLIFQNLNLFSKVKKNIPNIGTYILKNSSYTAIIKINE